MPVVGFTHKKVVDGMIKGGLGWLTKSAIFTWCGRYPSTVLHADNVPHVASAVMLKYKCSIESTAHAHKNSDVAKK